jgi:hypothetical protein
MDFKSLISKIESIDGKIDTPKAPQLPKSVQLNEDAQLRVLSGRTTYVAEAKKKAEEDVKEADDMKVGDKKNIATGTVEKTKTGIVHKSSKAYGGSEEKEADDEDDKPKKKAKKESVEPEFKSKFMKMVEAKKEEAADKKKKMAKKEKMAEAAKWRDPKHKDKLYTQEPYGDDDDRYSDDDYYNPKPDDYPGSKNLKGGGEFDHNDPLRKGYGRYGTGSMNTHGKRKGMPSRDQISSLKGSIKSAHGTHKRPNLPEGAKPDFLDLDKDGNKKEPMKSAAGDKGSDKKDSGKKGMSAAQEKFFGKKKTVKESVEQKLSFKQMVQLVQESGGQQQIDAVDKALFTWAERVAKNKLGEGMKADLYAGLVYERNGGVFEMYDVLSEAQK